jgi:exodeoxyribonuclease VII large subunit
LSTDWPFRFDVGEPAAPHSNIKVLTVSELSFALKRTLEENFGLVRVRGEISKVSRPGSGHCYLDLKDDRSVICAVIWKNGGVRLAFKPEPGLEVVITGRITTFSAQSRYQIVIDSMEPAGAGALMALLEQRRRKLHAEGLFDVARKKPLPFLPRVIGVVTSPTGAVLRDILHRLADRFPRHVVVWPVRVQGERSAEEISAAIRGFNALRRDGIVPRPDLIIVARGGGSIEDLWSFSAEEVVRAAAGSAIPLIAAVGHETDWTLIDHAADWRAPTPTAAAERAVPVRAELVQSLIGLDNRSRRGLHRLWEERRARLLAALRGLLRCSELVSSASQRFDSAAGRLSRALVANTLHQRMRLQRLAPRLSLTSAQRDIARHCQMLLRLARQGRRAIEARMSIHRSGLDQRGQGALRALEQRVELSRRRLMNDAKLLATLSHRSVLGRGYALVTAGSRLVSSVASARPGLAVTLRFHDGETGARIDSRQSGHPRSGTKSSDQGSLF